MEPDDDEDRVEVEDEEDPVHERIAVQQDGHGHGLDDTHEAEAEHHGPLPPCVPERPPAVPDLDPVRPSRDPSQHTAQQQQFMTYERAGDPVGVSHRRSSISIRSERRMASAWAGAKSA
jgi:hypothetical protein